MSALAADLRALMSGEVFDDPSSRARYSRDFGRFERRIPQVVVAPADTNDVARVLRYANTHRVAVTTHAAGHSTGGQSLGEGILLRLVNLHALTLDEPALMFHGGAGATWSAVVRQSVNALLAPPVLTNYLQTSLGGTHSVGGGGITSYRHGTQIDNCLALEVVTAAGEIIACDEQHDAPLFRHALGGLGLFGVMTRVTHRLERFSTRSVTVRLFPTSFREMLGLVDTLMTWPDVVSIDPQSQGQVSVPLWKHALTLSVVSDKFDSRAFRARLQTALPVYHREEDGRQALLQFADQRLAEDDAHTQLAHPWMDVLLPLADGSPLLAQCLGLIPDWLRPHTLLLFNPIAANSMPRPAFARPLGGGRVLCLSVLPSVAPADAARADDVIAAITAHAIDNGGKRYLSGRLRFDWHKQFGEGLQPLLDFKASIDPHHILNPHLLVPLDATG